jgi:hypothetical protein
MRSAIASGFVLLAVTLCVSDMMGVLLCGPS